MLSETLRHNGVKRVPLRERDEEIMRIALANDHAGLALKKVVAQAILALGNEVIDRGTDDDVPVDFPDVTFAACDLVRQGHADRAILVCGTGVGAVMAANKIPGIRAGIGHDVFSARQGVEHDDANAMAIGAWLIGPAIAREAVAAFLNARFNDTDDVRRRVGKLRQLELDGARELAGRGETLTQAPAKRP